MENILFIHSAGPQGEQEGSGALITDLRKHLEKEFELIHPAMPSPEAPNYQEWKKVFERELNKMNGKLLLVGHSMGGSFLMKYLSEETVFQPIKGLFVIASPFWGLDPDWQSCADFFLREGFEQTLPKMKEIILYHSLHEEIVPIAHHKHYARKLPNAITRQLEGSEHLFQNGLPELVQDIKNIAIGKV